MKTQIEAIKKIQIKGILEVENMGKWLGITDAKITNIKGMEESISGIEDTIDVDS